MIKPTDETLTGTTTPDQSEPVNNDNEGVLNISKALELEPHHQMQFSVIPRILVEKGVLHLFRDTVSVFYNHSWMWASQSSKKHFDKQASKFTIPNKHKNKTIL